jgi:hypothetical protein
MKRLMPMLFTILARLVLMVALTTALAVGLVSTSGFSASGVTIADRSTPMRLAQDR